MNTEQVESGVVIFPYCMKIENQNPGVGSIAYLSQGNPTDMSSVTNLEGAEKMVQGRLENQQTQQNKATSLLINSPTFNTLDNRFDQFESRNVINGGVIQNNSSREEDVPVQNYFADLTTWPGLKDAASKGSGQSIGLDDGPRLASPNALVTLTYMNDEFSPPEASPGGLNSAMQNTGGLLSQRDSLTNKSNHSKRAQPSQGAQGVNLLFNMPQLINSKVARGAPSNQGQKSPKTHRRSQTLNKKNNTYRNISNNSKMTNNSKRRTPTPEDICERNSPLGKSLNVVSSDCFEARKPSTSNGNQRDGYKKMNKEPMSREQQRNQTVVVNQLLRKGESDCKHSAHVVRRSKIPSIANQLRFKTNLNRLNLKTREELVSKTSLLNPQPHDRFDVSVDLSHAQGDKSGYSMTRTPDTAQALIARKNNNKIDSSFLQQSEILRQKPDGFRRISIQTDVEFGGQNNSFIGQGLHPLSPNRVQNPIMEDERGVEEDDSIMGISESNSCSLLPKKRRVHKQIKIQDSVMQSRNESSRLADILSYQSIAPSIKKALKDRAHFYRRKLTFYENLGILATSMTSQEIKAKLAEAAPDLNSSQATSIMNQFTNLPGFNGSVLSSMQDKSPLLPTKIGTEIDDKLPMLIEAPDKELSGPLRDSLNLDKPMLITDFRPKDMTVRRSRILQSIDLSLNYDKSQLPKCLEQQLHRLRQHSETVRPLKPKLNTSRNNQSVFSRLMAARVRTTSREHSVPSASANSRSNASPRNNTNNPTIKNAVPNSRSMFKRITADPKISDTQQQVWRRVSAESPLEQYQTVATEPKSYRMPSLQNKKDWTTASKTERQSRNQSRTIGAGQPSHVKNLIKDLMTGRVASLQPIKLPAKQKKELPAKKVKLANKLSISPLNQELKGLGPTSPSKQVFMREPKLFNYSHREVVLQPIKRTSPNTTLDEGKPSFMNKNKAQKLVLLQKTIKTLKQ